MKKAEVRVKSPSAMRIPPRNSAKIAMIPKKTGAPNFSSDPAERKSLACSIFPRP